MKRYLLAVSYAFLALCCAACNSSSGSPTGVTLQVTGSFSSVESGSAAKTLNVVVSGDSGNAGVTWTLSLANATCSPGCGALKPGPLPSLSAVYTPPSAPPTSQTATITIRSNADPRQVFVFDFQISPPIGVQITNKFSSQSVGGPVTDITATITNDSTNQGLSWTLTAGGTDCHPGCGTLTVDPSPSLTAHYQPPATPPSSANASPTITASSVADSARSDSFSFTINTPAASVMITNKFQSQIIGGPAVAVNATITNDFLNVGLNWSLTAGGTSCAPTCGTLTPIGSPSNSASYTPPTTLPAGANAMPTISASSVSQPSASDSFQFTILGPVALFKGSYAFLLRGNDKALKPMAISGVLTSDGSGNITGGAYDLNDNTVVTSVTSPLSGSYTVDNSFHGIPHLTINLTSGSTTRSLKAVLAADGTRGKAIEFDSSLALAAGPLLRQDTSAGPALAASTSSTSFAFGLDSDAPVNGRVVEAGSFVLGAGATSITGGIADEGQAGAANPILGGAAGAASINPATSSATAPDSSGRGTLTLSIAGNNTQYAYYVVNASQLNLIEIDSGGTLKTVQAGTARVQKPLSSSSIAGTLIAGLTGMTSVSSAPSPSTIIGELFVTPPSPPSAQFDANDAGTVTLSVFNSGGFISPLNATTGRAEMSNTFFPDAVIYLYDVGKGFLIDVTPTSTTNGTLNHGFSGTTAPQVAGPFSVAKDLSGNLMVLAGASSSASMPNFELAINSDGAKTFLTLGDFTTSNTNVGASGQVPNVAPSWNFTLSNPNGGYGQLSNLAPAAFGDFSSSTPVTASFYLIGPGQFVAIAVSGGNNVEPSGVLVVDPD